MGKLNQVYVKNITVTSPPREGEPLGTRKRFKGLKRTLFNQTKQDRMRIFEEILFFKAANSTKLTNHFAVASRIQLQKEVTYLQRGASCASKFNSESQKNVINLMYW